MVSQWKVQEEKAVEVDARHLKMQSAQAIRSVEDALVELVTNSDDAYGSGDEKGKIIITVTRERGERSGIVEVRDRAGGMTLNEMKQKILRYGAFSAGDDTRGFMGRGAKDIVALGPATFESVKNDHVYRVDLDSEFRCRIMKPIKASEHDYIRHGLRAGKGGMEVTLEVNKRNKVPRHETLVRDLRRNFALRDIFQRREVRLVDGRSKERSILRYTPPEGLLFCDELVRFESPYAGATARLVLFKANAELPSELQEGIIVTDGRAIHQVTRFASDLEEDRIARRFFGRLECSYIRQLQLDFEERRCKGEEPLEDNPVDIVDPNRRRGLDKEAHPFVRMLFEWAEEWLRSAVEEVREEEGENKPRIANEDTNKRLKALCRAVAEHLQGRIEEETLSPRTKEQEASLQEEGVLLNPQFGRIMVGETKRLGYTVLSFGENEDPDHVSVIIEGKGITVDRTEPKLRPQRRNPERLSAYFEIAGVGPSGRTKLTVTHANELIKPVIRAIEVVEPEDPYANLPYGLYFEKQNYTVHNNGIRTLCFTAKGRRFRGVDWNGKGLLQSTREEAVTVLKGNTVSVSQVVKDVWHGEAQVRGQGVGRSSVVTLSITTNDGTETANTRVKVVHKDAPSSVSVDIQLVPDPGGQWRAQWDRENPNLLKIFAEHPTLARYLGPRDDQYPGQNRPSFRVLLAEIVADKVVQRILEAKAQANPRLFVDSQSFFFLYSEEMTTFLPIAHQVMLSDRDLAQMKQP